MMAGGHSPSLYLLGVFLFVCLFTGKKNGTEQSNNMKQAHKRKKKNFGHLILFIRKNLRLCLVIVYLALKPTTLYLELYFFRY